MRKAVFACVLILALTVSASAVYVPENIVMENRDGQQLIVKTFRLALGEDPSGLVEEPFVMNGYTYRHRDTVKEEQPFEQRQQHIETVTVETESEALDAVLSKLAPTMAYNDGTWSGTLSLDHASIQTEAVGYVTKSYTISDTRQFPGLERNDPSAVPQTTVKDGQTLKLSDLRWETMGGALSGESIIPSSYTAIATYTGQGSRKVATGYTSTASYAGEVVTGGIASVAYTVTYLGEPIPVPVNYVPIIAAACVGVLLLVALLVLLILRLRQDVHIYGLTAKGYAYKRLGRRKLNQRTPVLDFTKLHEYPNGDSAVEIRRKTAQRLLGRTISVRLFDGVRTHVVEDCPEGENYWFCVKEEMEKP